MAQSLTLKVRIVEQSVTKVIQFDASTQVYNACHLIRDKITDANLSQPKDYGLFLPGEDGQGVWLEPGRELRYYLLKNHDIVEYRRKIRPLKVRMLDGMVKTLMVDDSQPVHQLMVVICTKIGIMNHDEYSLVREVEQEEIENKPNFGTLTLRRRKEGEKERDAKMESLKKKLKTDDEINWVDHSKTLREQGANENEVLLLRRKYFFSDGNIDSQDPIQLNLLYVQCRDAIVDGTHPVTQEKACQFAGFQCQVQFGDFNESRHQIGFLDLKEFIPQSYMKVKGIEKKIFNQHRLHLGQSELDAKFKYVELARSLRTYGVTFFLVKEKMKRKNKLVPRLLGVTKDSVLRLDEKTKEILKTWPLTTVRRWAASPNTCTLDFGDYSDQYYPFQTTEGEQIAQLIAGYIDIILKKQRPVGYIGIEGDEGLALQEDSVIPMTPNIIQHWDGAEAQRLEEESISRPAIIRPGAQGRQSFKTGSMPEFQSVAVEGKVNEAHHLPSAQQLKVSQVNLTRPQQALVSTIDAGQTIITECIEDLEMRAEIPILGTDPASVRWKQNQLDSNKQTVTSQIAAMNAATAQVVTLTSSAHEEVDHTAVGTAISTITSNLPEMTKGVKMIASLLESDSDSDNLLHATKKLCSAFHEFLIAAEPERREPRQHLLGAATRVGDASKIVLTTIDEYSVSHEYQDVLLGMAKAVANTTAALILKTKAVASQSNDQELQNRVINAATNCALATSQLVACAKVLAPTIENSECQIQLIEACREVGSAVDSIVHVCSETTDDDHLIHDLDVAACDVNQALGDLNNYIKSLNSRRSEITIHEEAIETILISSEKLIASDGNSSEMVRQAKVLAQATSDLINSIRLEASDSDDMEMQNRLYGAAKLLADATSKMVEAAKECSEHPHDRARQERLIAAADNVRMAAFMAAGNAIKKKIIKKLETAARHAAATSTQCMAAAQGAGHYNTSMGSQDELIVDCKAVADVIPELVEGVKGTINNPESSRAQVHLINACNQFLQPGSNMVCSVKSALPTVTDQACSMQLSNSSKQFNQALADLRTATNKAQEACGSLEMESAIDFIQSLDEDLYHLKGSAADGSLRPLPGESQELAVQNLTSCSKAVESTVAQLVTSAADGNQHYTGIAAGDTAKALKEFSSSVRGVVATTSEHSIKMRLIDCAREVMRRSLELIEEARISCQSAVQTDPDRLVDISKGVSEALYRTAECLPGQRDVDEAIKNISSYTNELDSGKFPTSSKPYGELQTELSNAAVELSDASAQVVSAARISNQQLATSSKKFSNAFGSLIGVGMEMAGSTKDNEVSSTIVVSLKSVSTASSELLVSAKSISADPTAPNAKNQLQSAARAVTETINNLIDVCTSSAPGQRECDAAIRAIQSMNPLLSQPSEPVNETSYFECLENVMERSRNLGDGMTGIANHAKKLEHRQFGFAVKDVSSAICGLVESAAQSAYLVAVSDPNSVPGRAGLVDQSQFARAYQAIQAACRTLNDSNSNQQQVLSAATVIAKHTSALCNSCRVASAKTNNPVSKRQFVQSAKDVANATANLVKEIKLLDQSYSVENRVRCGKATTPLLSAVENLCRFARSPEFASVPAKISHYAREAQKPITSAGRSIIEGSCAMIEAAKSLAVNPKDPPTWQALAAHSKNVSDSIKNLVASIRDRAPGQRECDDAVDVINISIRDLDHASLCVIDENLPQSKDNNLTGFNEQVEMSCQALISCIDKVRSAGKSEAENLGHSVRQMASYINPLVNSSIGCASNMTNCKRQACFLDQTKSVLECALQLLYVAKETGGNAKSVQNHPEIDESADTMKEMIQELLNTGEGIATEAGVVSGLVESITMSINRCSETPAFDNSQSGESFVSYQSRMVITAKEMIRLAQDMVAKSTVNASELGNLGASMSHDYNKLTQDTSWACQLASSPQVAGKMRTCVQEVGQGSIELVKNGGACQAAPKSTHCQKELAESARRLGVKVTNLLSVLKEGWQGTQACIHAASTVSGIIGDLDTTILFATAGTLNAENQTEVFSDHRDHILKTAKALVEDTKTLVAGAASSQEQLASAAQNAVATIVQLAEVVKSGAASLGSNNHEAQVMLINAVKDVAMALGDLIQATKSASGKHVNDPAITTLKESAKVMVTNVTSLLKTVKTVEDEQMRGTQALEATIEAIAQEIRAFKSEEAPRTHSSPEDLVRATKPITMASAKAVSAGMSLKQDDVISTANVGRKAVSDMLSTCKSAAWQAETMDLRRKVISAGHDTAIQYRELLQVVLHCLHKQTPDSKSSLSAISRKIAQCVTNLVSGAEQLKGTDWEDPEDPTVIAENELLGAANSIEAAARKLQSLRPRVDHAKELDEENMNFEEIILDACKSIAAATGALIKAASRAQRELVQAGKVKSRPRATSDDGQWSEGLISAARLVAASTHSLCEAANSLVQGNASEEKLIASAKQVAASTAQLLVACKVKADPNSEATKRLQEAGNKVKKATDSLVRAAQQAIEQEEERTLLLKVRPVQSIVQDLQIREKILKLENELSKAREEQAFIYKAKANLSGQSDTDGNLSGYDSAYETTTRDKLSVTYTPTKPSLSPRPQRSTQPIESSFNRLNIDSTPPTLNTYHKSPLFSSINHNQVPLPYLFSEPSPEIVEGPSFKDAMKRFQPGSRAPTAEMDPSRSQEFYESENILKNSAHKIERTVTNTSTSRSYNFERS